MSHEFAIPGGRERGVALVDASNSALTYWIDTIGSNIAENRARDPRDKHLLAAMRAEMARRNGEAAPSTNGASPKPTASSNRRPAAQAKPAAPLAMRTVDKLAGSFADAHEASEALLEAASDYILVSPATHCGMLFDGTSVSITVVKIDTTMVSTKYGDKYPAGEVVPIQGGKVMLTAPALKKIQSAAGVDWDTEESGRLDDASDPHYCAYLAVGWVKNFDGTPRRISGEVDIDTREDRHGNPIGPAAVDIRTKAKTRHTKPGETNDGGDSQLLELRKFLVRQAQTKAKSRAIVDLIGTRSFTVEQLEKPFAVARLMLTGQTNDPVLKRLFAERMLDSMLGSSRALFGRTPSHVGRRPAQRPPPPMGSARSHADDEPEVIESYDDESEFGDDLDNDPEDDPPAFTRRRGGPPPNRRQDGVPY